jgi:RPA family protein
VKYAKANTVHTQQFIAQYGKAARYPVCQAWLSLRSFRAELIERMKDEVSFEKVLNSTKQMKEEAEGAIKQFRKERKEKEANLA